MQPLSTLSANNIRATAELNQFEGYTQNARSVRSSSGDSRAQKQAQLNKVAADFDTLFARQMLKEMRNSSMKSSLFGESSGLETYQQMFDDELAGAIGKAGGFGLGQIIIQDLSPQLERLSGKEFKEALRKVSSKVDNLTKYEVEKQTTLNIVPKKNVLLSQEDKKITALPKEVKQTELIPPHQRNLINPGFWGEFR